MHKMSTTMEKISLLQLLTVDAYGEIVYIRDQNANSAYELIPNRAVFFNSIFSGINENGITIFQGNQKQTISMRSLLTIIERNNESCLVLIEGFAGCGKSTLVQYILAKQLETYEYDYNLYNYDLEAQNEIITKQSIASGIAQQSSIFNAIKKSFYEQFIKVINGDSNVINEFIHLLKLCQSYTPFNGLYYDFYIRYLDDFKDILRYAANVVDNKEMIERKLVILLDQLSENHTYILALDYLLRLAIYKCNSCTKLYICYDNLDAIEDANDLQGFDEKLANFRMHIDAFIITVYQKGFFAELSIPHFVILATYRKITASMVNIQKTVNNEVRIDEQAGGRRQERHIFHIDATSAFSYKEIVKKRNEYFVQYLNRAVNISSNAKAKLLNDFSSWNDLNQKLEIMKDRYACLWNKNYRTCSIIANELYTDYTYDFSSLVRIITSPIIQDDYNQTMNAYYGGSAILLNCICKLFSHFNIWKLLKLVDLRSEPSPENVSFSRILLTYLYNKKLPVSMKELYDVFCKDKLFDYHELCEILSNMLARNLDGVWRRPLYYCEECILSNDATVIEQSLIQQCEEIKKEGKSSKNIAFTLCDSGIAYVERLMQEFEFFSIRCNDQNMALYANKDYDQIEKIIREVYNAVSKCCQSMSKFRENYTRTKAIDNAQYLKEPIHPTTSSTHSPQLHTERIIFSHIAYLNNVRLYYLNHTVTPEFEIRKKYNILFVKYISEYLELYNKYIRPISSQRDRITDSLSNIVKTIRDAIDNHSNKEKELFKTIAL